MNIFELLNMILSVAVSILLFGNFVYPTVALIFGRKKTSCIAAAERRYAVMICARNEDNVIADLIESIKNQDYPSELVDIFVLADNCSDDTAVVAEKHGAITFIRNDKKRVGKGYALNYLYAKIILTKGDIYDGFFVFDADNLLKPDFISRMNSDFCGGNSVLTSFRNTKNYGDSCVSAGYSIGWMFMAELLNSGRKILGIPCFVSGTGFLIGAEVLRKSGGWNWFTLTEDCEFTTYCALNGVQVGVCSEAEFYDEQPVSFKVSWTQRLRWAKGKYQALGKYLKDVAKGLWGRKFLICLDALANMFPTGLLVLFSAILTFFDMMVSAQSIYGFVSAFSLVLVRSYLSVLFLGILTLLVCWKRIDCSASRKLLLALYYPIHIAMYMPITFVAAFKTVEWIPIKHGVSSK